MKDELQHYELTFIIPGKLPEDQHPAILDKVNSLLKQNQAQIISQENLGRKKLAYAIKNLRHGFYRTLIFDLEPRKLEEIEKELKLDQNILRFLVTKKHLKTQEEKLAEEKAKTRIVKEKISQETKPEKPTKTDKEKKKVSLEDLDKKLDEILDEDIV